MAIFTFLLSCLFTQEVTFAHPGGTDADGGHYCHTDCEKYGLEYEEYHYHDVAKDESDITPIEIILTFVVIGFFVLGWWFNRN
ncbi:hypothetical protein [Priestia aryabhattai]|uniref:hypothetical protein n=1 Tax=Priestia aryabhattai TaxID=412384 RepID=UPI001ADBB6C3|nr:hypothetical protein J5Z55_02315 [Priestia aryabhattai]